MCSPLGDGGNTDKFGIDIGKNNFQQKVKSYI